MEAMAADKMSLVLDNEDNIIDEMYRTRGIYK